MSNQKPIHLPLDWTGSSPLNLIQNETHELAPIPLKVIKPQYAPFYKKGVSITVTDASGSTYRLEDITDYQCIELVANETKETGLEIYRFILITRQNISGTIAITYQSLGGQQNGSVQNTLQAANAAVATDVKVPWSEVHDKPMGFTPKAHAQDVEDIYGMEYLKDALARVSADLTNTANSRKRELNAAIQALIKEWISIRKTPAADLSPHLNNYSNSHGLSKAQIGLSDVENFEFCTPASLKTLLSSDW